MQNQKEKQVIGEERGARMRARRQIDRMDDLARQDSAVHRRHPLAKLAVTVIYLTLLASCGQRALGAAALLAVYPAAQFVLSELSLRESLVRLRVVLPLVLLFGAVNMLFDRTAVAQIGALTITGGMLSALVLAVRGVCAVLACYVFIATTGMDGLCAALRMLHVPSILVTQIGLMYRYIAELLHEVEQTTQAYALRAPGQKGIAFHAWGSLTGQLLLRAVARAETLYDAMQLRGFTGSMPYSCAPFCAWDAAYLVLWCLLLPSLRWMGGIG